MLCEIINPSDPYTLETDDFIMAGVVIAILGNGQLGLRSLEEGSDLSTPILFGWDEWFKNNGVEVSSYFDEHAEEMADILDSIVIGKKNERQLYLDTVAALPEDKREEWKAKWKDQKQSSLNDIGGYAEDLSKRIRERAKKPKDSANA